MSDQLKSYADIMDKAIAICREGLKRGLAQCTDVQRFKFKQMYSHENLDADVNDIVDGIDPRKLDWAMQQVQRTVDKNIVKQKEG